MIGKHFDRQERWGRLIKNAGLAGQFEVSPPAEPHEPHVAA
jgi:hypothetical protein